MNECFCGIDLASFEKNPTGISVLEIDKNQKIKVKAVTELYSNQEIIDFIKKYNPIITAIDAPFGLGTRSFRECETRLLALGYKLMPPSFLMDLVKRVQKIKPEIKGKLIEVHPNTSKKAIGLELVDFNKCSNELCQIINGLPERDLSIHEIDSLVAAYTAYLYNREDTVTYGDKEGKIIVPVPRVLKLAVLDLDGTITKPASSWEYFHQQLGTWDVGKVNLDNFLAHKIDYKEFARADVEPWAGTSIERVKTIVDSIEYVEGIEKLIQALRKKDIEVAIISGGLSVVAEKVVKDFGIKHVFANNLNHDGIELDGTVSVKVNYNGKLKIYKKLIKNLKVKPYEVITVGDSSGDIVLFENSGIGIAINPLEKKVSDAALISVNDAKEIIKYLGL